MFDRRLPGSDALSNGVFAARGSVAPRSRANAENTRIGLAPPSRREVETGRRGITGVGDGGRTRDLQDHNLAL